MTVAGIWILRHSNIRLGGMRRGFLFVARCWFRTFRIVCVAQRNLAIQESFRETKNAPDSTVRTSLVFDSVKLL